MTITIETLWNSEDTIDGTVQPAIKIMKIVDEIHPQFTSITCKKQ
jgi:hypothetical protein